MPRVRADYVKEILVQMQDGAEVLDAAQKDKLIDRANEIFARKKPFDRVIELTSAGGDFDTADLTGFDAEISGDPRIEYPVVESGEPQFLDRRDWQFHRKPVGGETVLVIRTSAGISAGQNVRFHYKGLHTITANGSTVPEAYFYAFCKLAAAEGCDILAQHFTQSGESTLLPGVDTAYYITKASEYEKRATKLRKQANEAFGAGSGESGQPAASVTKNWDTTNSVGGDRLTHRRRFR